MRDKVKKQFQDGGVNGMLSDVKSLAQTPGPDLACEDAVMESQAFISSENSCMCISRRARAGWQARAEFYELYTRSITVAL